MSISRQNLTVVIVTLKSQHIIDQCIQSIDSDISILIVENSNNINFKNKVEKKFSNVECFLAGENLGYGKANNFGLEKVKTKYSINKIDDIISRNLGIS